MAYLVPSFLAFLCVVSTVYGLSCYKCFQFELNNGCGLETEECREGSTKCFTASIPQLLRGKGCVPPGETCKGMTDLFKHISQETGTQVTVNCETCSGNKCNSATL